jgi:asparagine synthase (glutamine-hydrolysing)
MGASLPMIGLLGGVAEPGELLDPERIHGAAGEAHSAGERLLLGNRMALSFHRAGGNSVGKFDSTSPEFAFLLANEEGHGADDNVCVRFHGTLFNLAEIAAQTDVELAGDPTGQGQQNEAIRRAYQRWGRACFARFRGSFACAVLDLAQNKLLIANDHAGSRALYYTRRAGFFFASSIRQLLALSGLAANANPAAVRQWLRDPSAGEADTTFFDGVEALPPAGVLELDLNNPEQVSRSSYWAPDELPTRAMRREEAAEQLRSLLAASIEVSTRWHPAVGVTLSGGLDSSVLLAAARGARGQNSPLHSFTFVSSTRASQMERERAQAMASLCRTHHHLVEYDGRRIPEQADALLVSLEQPIASPVLFAHRQLYRAASEAGVQSLLHGQGADVLFAGSTAHLVARSASLCRSGRLVAAATMLSQAASGRRRVQLFRALAGSVISPAVKAALRPATEPAWLVRQWFVERIGAAEPDAAPRHASLRHTRVQELHAQALLRILCYEERAGDAHAVCSVSPFLSPEVIAFALSLPEELLIGGDGFTKSLLRFAYRQQLPRSIVENRRRTGFPVPAAEWLMQSADWADAQLANSRKIAFLHSGEVQKLWESFRHGGGQDGEKAMRLWQLIFLVRWANAFGIVF